MTDKARELVGTVLLSFLPPLLSLSCSQEKNAAQNLAAAPTTSGVTVKGRSFVDAEGRQVILHGVNVGTKDKKRGYIGTETEKDFDRFRQWGFNCIRLMIFWDGVEPEPGRFDREYLDRVAQLVQWAGKQGLHVILDMHQDLYSARFADGAPSWATLTDGNPHLTGAGIWSDAYFTSPAVQTALDRFWNNASAPDGLGLQDHYARAWRFVAQYFSHDPAVLGYDLMNEPFPGKAAREAQVLMFKTGAELLKRSPSGLPTDPEALAQLGLTPGGRSSILNVLCDRTLYTRVVDAAQPVYSAFERAKLVPLYQKVAAAIREVDKTHILFLEPSMASNMGVPSAIEAVTLVDGGQDPYQAYAPHGYDLVTDTPEVSKPCSERVRLIFERHGQTAERLVLPMLVGEWGAYGRASRAEKAAWEVVHLFEQLLCSETYWKYESGIDRLSYFMALWRPYPERVAGRLISYGYDEVHGKFQVEWREQPAVDAPTVVYIPAWLKQRQPRVTVAPLGGTFDWAPLGDGQMGWQLRVPAARKTLQRKLIVEASPAGGRR